MSDAPETRNRPRVRSAWVLAGAVVIAVGVLAALPAGRQLFSSFFGSLRQQPVRAVSLNLSSFVGPRANHTVQQMISQMISDKVTTTVSQKPQPAADATEASQIAGFHARLLGARRDQPRLTVSGVRAFTITVDRARLQAILSEAGRSNLKLPTSIDGARVTVRIPHMLRARYGICPRPPSATANIATPPPSSSQYNSCLVLAEGPSPQVRVPSGLSLAPLAQIGLEAAGMTAAQARQFLQTVDWKSVLAMPLPRFMRSYQTVAINGAKGTLLNLAGRRGATYTLIWAEGGMVYSLTGFGNPANAVKLADSVGQ